MVTGDSISMMVEVVRLRKPLAILGLVLMHLVALREKFQLWEQPFEDMCRIMGDVHVRDFMQIPTEGEFVDETDTLNVAIHRIVMGRHHSLLVTRGKEIVGILRSTDLFNTFYEMLAACKAL